MVFTCAWLLSSCLALPAMSLSNMPRLHARNQNILSEEAKQVSPTQFPLYVTSKDYKTPLDKHGQQLEQRVVNDITSDALWKRLVEIVTNPNADGAAQTTRSFANPKATESVVSYIEKSFKSMGFDHVCMHNFTVRPSWHDLAVRGADQLWRPDATGKGQEFHLQNVIAFVDAPGGGTVTVGAHLDSRPYSSSHKAPGAVDNGSGLATVLQLAQAFQQEKIRPTKPVYFVAFGAEEIGMLGSQFFVDALKNSSTQFPLPKECMSANAQSMLQSNASTATRDELAAQQAGFAMPLHEALIMDEVGWKDPKLLSDTLNFESFDATRFMMDHLAASSRAHNGDSLTLIHSGNPFGSDHMSWLDRKMPAVLSIQGDDEQYPNYHKSSDTLDQVDKAYLTKVAKMEAGALVRMAGVQDDAQA